RQLYVAAGLLEPVVVGIALDELPVVLGLQVAGGCLLESLEAQAGRARDLLDLGEQVVDGLVALRGDADAPAVGEQVHDDPGPGPRLAGAGRPLEKQVARVEPEGQRLHRREVGGLDPRAGSQAADAGALAGEDGSEGRIAT